MEIRRMQECAGIIANGRMEVVSAYPRAMPVMVCRNFIWHVELYLRRGGQRGFDYLLQPDGHSGLIHI